MNKFRRSNGHRPAMVLLALAVVISSSDPVLVQEPAAPMAGTVGQWFAMIEKQFVSLADAMPADKFDFKPTTGAFADVRTFGEQVKHVACANFGFFNEIEKKEPPAGCGTGGPSPAKTKEEIMAYLRESFTYAGRVMQTLDAGERTRARRRTLRRQEHATGPDDARGLARLRSLRPAGCVSPAEWYRAAGEPAIARAAVRRVSPRRQEHQDRRRPW